MNSKNKQRLKSTAEIVVSVVLPVYNEIDILQELYKSIDRIFKDMNCPYEIIFVDDGSSDGSSEMIDTIAASNSHVKVLHFSRNFGHQSAVHAGLIHARGDVIVVMDSDLQDDPASIPLFIKKWQEGYDVVYAIRTERKESALMKFFFAVFYRVLKRIASLSLPNDAGNFGLIDQRVAREVVSLHEQNRFYPGLRNWVGFSQIGIDVPRNARYDKSPRVSFCDLLKLAKNAIFSFSTFPLSIFHAIAFGAAMAFAGLCCFTLYHKIFTELAIPGWTSIIMTGCFFGFLNALGIGILGEYILRIYEQVKNRPMFIIERKVNFSEIQNNDDIQHSLH